MNISIVFSFICNSICPLFMSPPCFHRNHLKLQFPSSFLFFFLFSFSRLYTTIIFILSPICFAVKLANPLSPETTFRCTIAACGSKHCALLLIMSSSNRFLSFPYLFPVIILLIIPIKSKIDITTNCKHNIHGILKCFKH